MRKLVPLYLYGFCTAGQLQRMLLMAAASLLPAWSETAPGRARLRVRL